MNTLNRSAAPLLVALFSIASTACGGRHHLDQYDFAGTTLAAVHDLPAYPDVRTGPYRLGEADDMVGLIVQAGSRAAREVEARRARDRLDQAARQLDFAALMGARTVDRASRYLGAAPSDDDASAGFLLEVYVRSFGIDAHDWDVAADMFLDAEATLLDRRTGREVWRSRVRSRDALTPAIIGDIGPLPRDVITAGALATLSVEDLQRVLERLAEYSSDRITDRLRDDLRDVRSRR